MLLKSSLKGEFREVLLGCSSLNKHLLNTYYEYTVFKNIKAIVLTQTGLPVMSPETSSISRGLLVLLNTHLEDNIK